jgi:O-antigen/teichoic acid export membrane protein
MSRSRAPISPPVAGVPAAEPVPATPGEPRRGGPPSVGDRATRGAPWVAAGAWANRFMLAAVLAVLARTLTPREFGLLSVALVLSNLLMALNDLGFANALVYQQRKIRAAAETILLITIVVGIALTTGMVLVAPALGAFFRVPRATGVIDAYAVLVAVNAVSLGPIALLSRDLDFRRRFIVDSVPSILGGVLTIGLALSGFGVWSLVLGDGIRHVLTTSAAFVMSPIRARPRFHRDVAREMWRYARGSVVASTLDFALLNIDYVLIGRLLGPIALGYYALAFRIAIMPFYTITMVVIGVSWPALARLTGDLDRVRAAFRESVRLAAAALFLMAGGIVALAPWVVVLGRDWGPAVGTIRLLGVYVCLRSAAYLMAALFQATGHPSRNAVLRGIWVVLLGGLILAIGRGGILVVAVVQVAVAILVLALYLRTARRTVGLGIAGFLEDFGRPAVAATIAGAVVVVCYELVRSTNVHLLSWWGLGIAGAIFAGLYLLCLLLVSRDLPGDIRGLRARYTRGVALS